MKWLIPFMLPFAAFAQLGADRSVVAESVSNVHTNYSWAKNVIMETEDGALRDKRHALATSANAAAQQTTADQVGRVAQAWRQGFSNGVESLSASLSNVPRTGRFIGLKFPLLPQTSRTFDIHVVSNRYNSTTHEDELWIYFGQSFTNAPTITVPYVYESGLTTNRVAGSWKKAGTSAHFTNTVDLTVARASGPDIVYPKCHKLFVPRPAELRGVPCNLNPNGVWGGPTGVAFGSYLLTVTVSGTTYPTYTGPVTNQAAGVVALFDNGAFLGTVPIESQEED